MAQHPFIKIFGGGHLSRLRDREEVKYRMMTLQASLEEATRLGNAHLLSGAGEYWRAKDLLAWLKREHPDLLSLPVALVSPDANGDGAVFEVDLEGEPITDVPLYRLARHLPPVDLLKETTDHAPS